MSELRCELNLDVSPQGLVGTIEGVRHLWRVWIDGKVISEMAMPFGPADHMIELEADERSPVRGDGHGLVSARRVGEYVAWIYPDTLWGRPGLGKGDSYVFRWDEYVREIERCVRVDVPDTVLKGSLPELKEDELRSILRHGFPDLDALLYTQPTLPDDPRGRRLAGRIKAHLIDEPIDVAFCDEAADVIDLTFGLDLDGSPEAHWEIGRSGDGWAIRFVSHPGFGLWLYGECVDAAIGEIATSLYA